MKDRNYWKERLPLIQAYCDGSEITMFGETSLDEYEFDGHIEAYKIMPKPDPYQEFRDALRVGKQVQFKNDDGSWKTGSCEWSFGFTQPVERYRIKPERKLVPFDFSHADELIGKTIKNKSNGGLYLITKVSELGINAGMLQMTYEGLLKCCTFTNDSPCGKWVEE